MKPCGSSGDAVTKFGIAPTSGTMASPKSMVHRVIAKQLMFARLASTFARKGPFASSPSHPWINKCPPPGAKCSNVQVTGF